MKMPKRPPDVHKIFENSEQKQLIFEVARQAANDGKYYHWEDLRHRKPPDDLSNEEWWAALKMARHSQLMPLPLRDVSDEPFWFGLPAPVPEHLHHIDQDAGGRIEVAEQQTMTSDTRDRYLIHSLIEEAITSSQLEGATTTRPVAKEMIASKREPKDLSERMIMNNYTAMQKIQEIKDQPLSMELIFELHRILTTDTLDNPSAAGRFRQADEPVHVYDSYGEVLHAPPPADELKARVEAMCDFANGKTPKNFVHPVIRAITLHFWLAYVHPFADGNGRCARALFYWSMLRQGYWLCEFISISQIIKEAPIKYGTAFLYTETDENDLTYFILYHLDLIRRAIEELHAYIKRKINEVRDIDRLIKDSAELNHRQKALLSHALRHPDTEYTIQVHKSKHNIVYQTARVDIQSLEKKGLLISHKAGRRFYFLPIASLQERLKETD